ncbi:multicopper oxidase-domain-containing protein [Xylaria sp. FL1777]|nr:multicopper oxidase-domain-containing protein [Xylaria sp. FL1777]
MLINGMYPGLTITVDWSNIVSVTVTNQLTLDDTWIHWHGLRQLGTNLQGGTGGISECPIPPGSSKTYTSRLADSVFGAIRINGPSANYDIDLGVYPSTTSTKVSLGEIVKGHSLIVVQTDLVPLSQLQLTTSSMLSGNAHVLITANKCGVSENMFSAARELRLPG